MRLTGFEGRTAFVTGAAGGMGGAVVTALREAGVTVCATDMAGALEHSPLKDDAGMIVRDLDIRDYNRVKELIAETEERFGPISLAVHAAGALHTALVTETSPEDFRNMMEINAGGAFNILSCLGATMAPRGKGSIVMIGSNVVGVTRHGMGPYSASKAAATLLARCMGLELAGSGVRVNIIAPGSTLTPMQTGMWGDDSGAVAILAGDLPTYRTGIPLSKFALPEDIAAAVMFLLSDQADHVTMTDLYVDGGATLRT